MATLEHLQPTGVLDDDAFRSRVFSVMQRELGLSDYIRFMQMVVPASGNWTEERHAILDGDVMDDSAQTSGIK